MARAPRNKASRLRLYIERLGPYQSLVLLAIPVSLVEPLKLAALAVAGVGHWITGTIMIICAYATSLLIVERLFRIVKPKLMTLPWFARIWGWVVAVRGHALGWFRRTRSLPILRRSSADTLFSLSAPRTNTTPQKRPRRRERSTEAANLGG